jgi:hypothetical protein
MKKQKHATSSPAELGKLLRILGTKKQRERTPLAWYRTERGLAVRLTPGGGVVIIAGEPGTVEAAARGEITTSRASFAGRATDLKGKVRSSRWSRPAERAAIVDATEAGHILIIVKGLRENGRGGPAEHSSLLPHATQYNKYAHTYTYFEEHRYICHVYDVCALR